MLCFWQKLKGRGRDENSRFAKRVKWRILIAAIHMSSFNSHCNPGGRNYPHFIQKDTEPWENMEISCVQPAAPSPEGWSLYADPGVLACFAILPDWLQEDATPRFCLQVTSGPTGSPKEWRRALSTGTKMASWEGAEISCKARIYT